MTSTSTSPPVSARDLFPFEQGERIVLASTLPKNLSEKLRRFRPQIAEKLSALDGRSLTIEVAGDELVAFVLRGELELPQLAGHPAGESPISGSSSAEAPTIPSIWHCRSRGPVTLLAAGCRSREFGAVRDGDGYVLGRRQDRSAEPLLSVLIPRGGLGVSRSNSTPDHSRNRFLVGSAPSSPAGFPPYGCRALRPAPLRRHGRVDAHVWRHDRRDSGPS